MLPGSEISIIDWLDFSQTLNPLGMPEAFSPALNLLTRNPITPEEERTAQTQIQAVGEALRRTSRLRCRRRIGH